MKNGRVKNSIYNVCATLFEYFFKLILLFITRTIFIRKLGSTFLGLDGLFTNILSILSVTELGLSGAIVFSLYKPLIDKDEKKINTIMFIYKKCYLVIGCAIFVIGLILMPFLPQIVNTDFNFGNLYSIFLLYLIQTLSTYWCFAYKEAILTADQKSYKLIFASNIAVFCKFIFQLFSLLVLNSFVAYLVSGILSTIMKNFIVAYIANKMYPYIKKNNKAKLSKKEMKDLAKNVFGMSLYKISSTVMNSTDNIIITIYVSITATGIYSNYLLIVSNLKIIISSIFRSLTASVGNLYAAGDKNRSEYIFRCINMMNFWIFGFVAVCLWELLNPFITLWVGEEYIFSSSIVFFIILNLVTDGLQQVIIMYKDACGLFWKGKLRPVFSALLNIIISLLLVRKLGILGVILGSIISRLLTTWWFDPYLVYKNAFEKSPRDYYIKYILSLLIIALSAGIIDVIMLPTNMTLLIGFCARMILSLIIPNVIFWLFYKNSEEYDYMKTLVINKFKRGVKS